MTAIDAPKKGERWVSNVYGKTCRVMSDPVEGYVMARYKGAAPWLVHISDWGKKFTRSRCDGKLAKGE